MLHEGHNLVMLIVSSEDVQKWQKTLGLTRPTTLREYPYVGLNEATGFHRGRSGSPAENAQTTEKTAATENRAAHE